MSIAKGSLALLAAVIVTPMAAVLAGWVRWAEIQDMLAMLLPVTCSVTGFVVTFYLSATDRG